MLLPLVQTVSKQLEHTEGEGRDTLLFCVYECVSNESSVESVEGGLRAVCSVRLVECWAGWRKQKQVS